MLLSLLRRRGEEASMGKKTPTITITPMVVTYNGQAISAPTVTTDSDGPMTYTYYKNGVLLQGAPVDAGSYTVRVETEETESYLAGSATGTITIAKCGIRLDWGNLCQEFTGTPLSPEVYINSVTMDELGVHINMAEAIQAGTYTCTAVLTGAKAYNYEIESGYETNTLTIAKMQIVTSPDAEVTYDGTNKWPSNTDYVTYSGAGTAIDAGTYQVTASLNDTQNTEWSDHTTADKTLTLTINAADISSCTVTDIDASYYTGDAITPIPTVMFGGFTLFESIDYRVSYSDNTNVGTASVIITGMDNFTGSVTVTFAIVQPMPTVFTLADPNSTAEFYEFSDNGTWSVQQAHTHYSKNTRVAIGKIHSGKNVQELVELFVESQRDNIVVYDKNSRSIAEKNWASMYAATGMRLNLLDTNRKVLDIIYVVIYGDIDQDGAITSADVTMLQKVIIGRATAKHEVLVACDLNFDGVVNTQDRAILMAKINGTADYEAGWS